MNLPSATHLRAGARGFPRPKSLAPSTWVLTAVLVVGTAARALAFSAADPVIIGLADSDPYVYFADQNAFGNPQHPAGYSLVLRAVAWLWNEVLVIIVLQHLVGLASAVILFLAVRRAAENAWPGVAGAAAIALGADQIYLEHTLMSETWFTFAIVCALYAAARSAQSGRALEWALVAGVFLAAATAIRTGGAFAIPVLALYVLLARRGAQRRRGAALAIIAGAVAVLVIYAGLNLWKADEFTIAKSSGWRLYSRVAPVADCAQFEPPRGTGVLCESTPADGRSGGDYYLYDPSSPANRAFGRMGNQDGRLRDWALEVIVNQPWAVVDELFNDVARYYQPGSGRQRPSGGGDLDPQLDWGVRYVNSPTEQAVESRIEELYQGIKVASDRGAMDLLHDYQRVARFGATALGVCTVLIVLGLLLGPGRRRLAVMLFGFTGFALLIAPTLTVFYTGRYTVPLAGPLVAAAAITVVSLVELEQGRRRGRHVLHGTPRRRDGDGSAAAAGTSQVAVRDRV